MSNIVVAFAIASAILLGKNLVAGIRLANMPKIPPVVVLPGFGNDMVDYINPRGTSLGLFTSLEKRGVSCKVVPIKRSNWYGNLYLSAIPPNPLTFPPGSI